MNKQDKCINYFCIIISHKISKPYERIQLGYSMYIGVRIYRIGNCDLLLVNFLYYINGNA